MTSIRYNYFDFLLDKDGSVLKSYLDGPEKGIHIKLFIFWLCTFTAV